MCRFQRPEPGFSFCRIPGHRAQRLLYRGHRSVHVRFGEGRVHQEHQAGLPQFLCDRQSFRRPEAGGGKGLLAVDLAAASGIAGDAFGIDGGQDPVAQIDGRDVATTLPGQNLRAQEHVILVVGVENLFRWGGDPQGGERGESLFQDLGMPAPRRHPVVKAPQLDPADGGLHFGHPPVGAEGLVQPAEPGRVLAAVNRVKALAMVLESPGAFIEGAVAGGQHPPLPAGGHDLVLAEGKGRGIAEGPDRLPLVACTVGLGAVLDDLDPVFGRQFQQRVHVAGPAGEMDGDDRLRAGGDQGTDRLGAQVLTHRIDIGDNRRRSAHDNAARRGDKGAGGGDHLVAGADVVTGEDQLQGDGAVGEGNGVLRPAKGGEFLFELAPFGPGPVVDLVGEEDALDGFGFFFGEGGPGGEGGIQHQTDPDERGVGW